MLFKTLTRGKCTYYDDFINADFYCRYRQVPTFGRGTVRRFSSNASAMKRLAGRDFEDLLQVSRTVSV